MKLSRLALACAALTAFSAGMAHADISNTEITRVSLHGVDMGNPAQLATLYTQLERAANQVCESDARSAFRSAIEDKACAREALIEAVKTMGNKRLLAYHEEKTAQSAVSMASVVQK